MTTVALLLFSALLFPIAGQTSDDLKLIDEFDPRQGCETLERKLDDLFSEATKSKSNAIVVIQSGENVVDSAVVRRKATGYPRFRGFPADQYTILFRKEKGDIRVEFWLGKNGKTPSGVPSDLDLTLPGGKSRVPFDEDYVEIVKLDGRDTFIGTGNPSCLYGLNFGVLWELLMENPKHYAEFRIRTKSAARYRLLVKILKREFVAGGAPTSRLKFIYAGRETEPAGTRGKYAAIETTLVYDGP